MGSLENFEELDELGKGAYSTVYKVSANSKISRYVGFPTTRFML